MGQNKLRSPGIVGVGAYVPERVLTNADLTELVDTNDEWVVSRTGIKERRVASPKETPSVMGTEAARIALADAGVSATDLDGIIVCTSTPDQFFPSTACKVQHALGARTIAAFDLSAACAGFVYGLVTACQMVATGAFDTMLVVGADVLSRFVNWQDRGTCILFGDGAGAVIIRQVDEGRGLLSFELGADGAGGEHVHIELGGSYRPSSSVATGDGKPRIYMNGNEVFKFAVRTMEGSVQRAMDKAGVTVDQLDLFVPHQANARIIQAAAQRLKVPPERLVMNVERYGNTSAASIPIALDEVRREGRLTEGDLLAFFGMGAGLTWGSCLLRW